MPRNPYYTAVKVTFPLSFLCLFSGFIAASYNNKKISEMFFALGMMKLVLSIASISQGRKYAAQHMPLLPFFALAAPVAAPVAAPAAIMAAAPVAAPAATVMPRN